jgi:hypothetical protein
MAATISIVKRSEFGGELAKVGGLMFPGEYYDATHHCDLKKISKANPELAGKRIYKILTLTDSHPDFANVVNEKITYKNALFCDSSHPMKKIYDNNNCNPIYVCDHPVGNVVIVVCG